MVAIAAGAPPRGNAPQRHGESIPQHSASCARPCRASIVGLPINLAAVPSPVLPMPPATALAARLRHARRLAAGLCWALLPWVAAGAAPPQPLIVEVRDSAPAQAPASGRGADGSYSVSTNSAADDSDSSGNGTTLATQSSLRRVHVVEGERIRVDLPAVQSLQFHVPLPSGKTASAATPTMGGARTASSAVGKAAGAASGTGTGSGAASGAAATGGSSSATAGGSTAAAAAPGASGVVYFEGIAAFAARFFLSGDGVRIELVPLRSGSVEAPYVPAAAGPAGRIVAYAPLGAWVPLGDSDLQAPGKSLNLTADAPSPAAVWVRVLRAP